jgi:hypothetical protein
MKSIALMITAGLLLATGPAFAGSGGYGSGDGQANPHKMGKIVSTSFEDIDSDKSGAISFEEFKAVFPRISEQGFSRLDTSGDGALSKEEWQAFKDAHKGMGNS